MLCTPSSCRSHERTVANIYIIGKLISNEIRGKYYIDLILGAAAGHGPYSLLPPPFLLLRRLVYAQMPINLDSVSSLCLFTLDMMDRECSSLYYGQGTEVGGRVSRFGLSKCQ